MRGALRLIASEPAPLSGNSTIAVPVAAAFRLRLPPLAMAGCGRVAPAGDSRGESLPDPADSIREQSHRLPRACYFGEVAVAYTARLGSGGEPIHRPRVPLIDALTASAVQHSCSAPIYCIMPSHVHVILQGTGGSADTWRAMVEFKQRSGFWLSRHLPGTRWQKDFYDHILRSEDEVRDALVYIAANPLRARLVRDPAEYPFTGSIRHGPPQARDR